MASFRRAKRNLFALALGIVGIAAVLNFTGPGRDILNLTRNGTIGALVTGAPPREYIADREANLKAIFTAIMLFHKSEDHFPDQDHWMDEISNRLAANDLSAEQAAKKLIRPDLAEKPDSYGYAINDEAAGKYKGDLKNPKTVLVFESKSIVRNAHGDAAKPDARAPKAIAITVDGSVVKL